MTDETPKDEKLREEIVKELEGASNLTINNFGKKYHCIEDTKWVVLKFTLSNIVNRECKKAVEKYRECHPQYSMANDYKHIKRD